MVTQVIGNTYVGDGANNAIDTSPLASAGAAGLDGNDRIFSVNGSVGHSFEGGRGADNLFFVAGANGAASGSLYGGDGNDLLSGSFGADLMYGGEGDDWIDGNWQDTNSTDNDALYGGAGRDALFGHGGNDVIYGGDGDDKGSIMTASPTTVTDNLVNFQTNAGLYGGAGNDFLDGGAGADYLHGGDGNDVMNGGSGADVFYFNSDLDASNVDHIRDFAQSEGDAIQLAGGIFTAVGTSVDRKEFVLGKKAKDKNDHIIYDQKNGTIAYDADGKGGTKAVVFATVEKGVKLGYADFELAT